MAATETPVVKIASQYFHDMEEPLDKSAQVATFADLSDTTKIVPHRGKLVHVLDEGKIYVCDANFQWHPLFTDDGKAFFITSAQGEVFKITAIRDGNRTGRIQVTYTA
jgi:hypothetical protein